MRESTIEHRLVKSVERLGGIAWKWLSNRRGLPDRIVLMPVPEEHREIVNRYVYFVETKSHVGSLSKQQLHVHEQMRALGYRVVVYRGEVL